VIGEIHHTLKNRRHGRHGDDVNLFIFNGLRNRFHAMEFAEVEFEPISLAAARQRSMPRPSHWPAAVFMANGGKSITPTITLSGRPLSSFAQTPQGSNVMRIRAIIPL